LINGSSIISYPFSQSKEAKRDAPPLCATYGDWIPPKQRKASQKDRCNAIGCMGHLPFENMKTALGPDLVKVKTLFAALIFFLIENIYFDVILSSSHKYHHNNLFFFFSLSLILKKVTDFVTVLRHPVKLFISEYYYIRDQLSKPSPSLQFVGDAKLLKLMMGGMTLAEYLDYVSRIVKHGNSGLRSAFNRQT
jgi:hypothetical protein